MKKMAALKWKKQGDGFGVLAGGCQASVYPSGRGAAYRWVAGPVGFGGAEGKARTAVSAKKQAAAAVRKCHRNRGAFL